ncbi:MAG TPA: gliding motility-associated C-terminal domain-containing protein [Cyclobacteriaceae bacterium]|nr:gliding motility-associated C-terminal domain-containing protein [Cyclobacteriaceae bacterium]
MRHFIRIPLILFFVLASPLASKAQFSWAHQIGSSGMDVVEQHVIDQDNNIIVVGYFENSVTIGGLVLTSMDESDMFLYKAKPNGEVIWVKMLGGPSYNGDVGLDVDADGNIYLAGGFIQELYFDDDLVLSSLAGNNFWNSFVSKFDGDGNMIWIKGILGTTSLSAIRVWGLISVSQSGLVVAGNFSRSLMIDDQVLSNPIGFPGNNLFITKFDLDGNLIWLKNPPSETNVECREIFIENTGTVYLTGLFTNTVHFDAFTLTATNNTHSDIYIAKLNPAGETQWAKAGLKVADKEDNNMGQSLTVDPQGNIYLIGSIKGDVKFDNLILHGDSSPEYWNKDSFVIKYNTNGDIVHGALFEKELKVSLSDIKYTSIGIFITGASAASQFLYAELDTVQLTGQTILLDGYGYPLHISFSPIDSAIVISGYMSALTVNQNQLLTKGNLDGFVASLTLCMADPTNVSAIEGPSEVCVGDSISYHIEPIENVTQFIWTIPAFLNHIGDSGSDPTISLNVTNDGKGELTVYALNKCGVQGEMSTISVQALALPAHPVLYTTECSDIITVQHGENVEWYKDGELIPDEHEHSLLVQDSGSYYAANRNYCGVSESEVVLISPISWDELFFANIITPNGDGKNDFFVIDSALSNSGITIYNRWGKQVFQKQPYDNSWNADNLASGIYYFSLSNPCNTKVFKGWIHVIKND